MKTPKAVEKLIESFQKLPGIGPKTAQRLAFYLLFVPQSELDDFSYHLSNLKKGTVLCSRCFNIGSKDPCDVCYAPERDDGIVCVVENPLDVVAIEKSGKYGGVYHVLHGIIDPLNNLGPDDIYIPQLLERIRKSIAPASEEAPGSKIREIILATNPTMEGEATAMYLHREIKALDKELSITRIGRGLPVGADLEYADEITLQRALEGRREY